MRAIPVELDKLLGLPTVKPAAEVTSSQADLFRRHLESPRRAPDAPAAARSSDPPRPPEETSSNDRPHLASAANDGSISSNQESRDAAESDSDPPEKEAGDDSAFAIAAAANLPASDADHAVESDSELKANADSIARRAKAGLKKSTAGAAAASPIGKSPSSAAAPNQSGATESTSAGESIVNSAFQDDPSLAAVTAAAKRDDARMKTVVARAQLSKERTDNDHATAERVRRDAKSNLQTKEHAAGAIGTTNANSLDGEASPDRSYSNSHRKIADDDVSTVSVPSSEPAVVAGDSMSGGNADPSVSRDTSAPAVPANVGDLAASAARPTPQVASRNVERSTTGIHLSDADQGRFLQRVARAFQAAQERDGEVRLRLSPPELGSLRLEIKVEAGVMSARLEAESPAARSLLIDNLPVLRERLAEQGMRIEHFDVDVMDRQTGSGSSQPQDHERNGQPSVVSARLLHEAHSTESNETVPRAPIRRPGDGRLNVIV